MTEVLALQNLSVQRAPGLREDTESIFSTMSVALCPITTIMPASTLSVTFC